MNSKKIVKIAMVAAVYTVVSLVLAPISYGPIQVRIAECLTLLPLIWMPSIYALTLGCFLTNLLGVAFSVTGPIDIIVGTLATLIASILTYKFKDKTIKNVPVLSILMPVIVNGVLVGIELACMLNPDMIPQMSLIYGLQVAAGELISVVLGWVLIKELEKTELFKD